MIPIVKYALIQLGVVCMLFGFAIGDFIKGNPLGFVDVALGVLGAWSIDYSLTRTKQKSLFKASIIQKEVKQ